jgi:hypothetical protein
MIFSPSKEADVPFVLRLQMKKVSLSQWITTIRALKSEGFFVDTVTTESSEDLEILIFSGVSLTT